MADVELLTGWLTNFWTNKTAYRLMNELKLLYSFHFFVADSHASWLNLVSSKYIVKTKNSKFSFLVLAMDFRVESLWNNFIILSTISLVGPTTKFWSKFWELSKTTKIMKIKEKTKRRMGNFSHLFLSYPLDICGSELKWYINVLMKFYRIRWKTVPQILARRGMQFNVFVNI